jgi:AIPR protein
VTVQPDLATSTNDRLYATLCRVLDQILNESNDSKKVNTPHPAHAEHLIQARSRALLHLFLKAKFGQTDYNTREKLVTDGPQDGGIDAYFIDKSAKIIYILQSKFKATASNFSSQNMSSDDILKMQVSRVMRGEKEDELGFSYNEKIIKGMQKNIKSLPDVGSYTTQVILLGNSKKFTKSALDKLVEGYSVDQYHHERIYSELLFPVVNGTYFNDPNLRIEISLSNVSHGNSHLTYDAKTTAFNVNVKLLFAPTIEMGRVMAVYKNSILKFNPRSFLELKNNKVNQQIEDSIRKKNNNEFSLFNNGITIISDRTAINSDTAKQGTAQLVLTNPQLVNGGQTAYVLGRIYEACLAKKDFKPLKGKEVLLRVITSAVTPDLKTQSARLSLVSSISEASNSQTKIDEADRRSSDAIQIELQAEFFKKFGMYYERKKGEFNDGLRDGYILSDQIINREKIIRISLAISYQIRLLAAGTSRFFSKDQLSNVLKIRDVSKYMYGYEVLSELEKLRGNKKNSEKEKKFYSTILRYATNAIVAVSVDVGMSNNLMPANSVQLVLARWNEFELWIATKKENDSFKSGTGIDLRQYYRGNTVDSNLKQFKFTTTA